MAPIDLSCVRGEPPMNLAELCEPLFLYVCRLNRAMRKTTELDIGEIRADIEEILNRVRTDAAGHAMLGVQLEKIFPAIVFFVDSVIVESELPLSKKWNESRLAHDLHTLGWAPQPEMEGDKKFVEVLNGTLNDPSPEAADRLEVLYTCLGLGGTAWFDNRSEEFKKKLLQCATRLRRRMGMDETDRICPQAYEHVDRGMPFESPRVKIGGIGIAMVVLSLVLFAINVYLYETRTKQMAVALKQLDLNLAPVEGVER